jgi:lipopolysaccharide export system protein LptA
MKIRSCNRWGGLAAALLVMAALVAGAVLPNRAVAADPVEKSSNDPIHITADHLAIDNASHTAVFSDHVTAVQGDTTIKADSLTIFYKGGSGAATPGANDIERLEARGNVHIFFDNRLAVSNQAVYIIGERKLILEGPGSKIVSGQDEIVGTKIVFDRNTGHMVLEGDDRNQVEAVIHSDQRGLN